MSTYSRNMLVGWSSAAGRQFTSSRVHESGERFVVNDVARAERVGGSVALDRKSDTIWMTHTRRCDVELPMRKAVVIKVDAHTLQGLALRFVDCRLTSRQQRSSEYIDTVRVTVSEGVAAHLSWRTPHAQETDDGTT